MFFKRGDGSSSTSAEEVRKVKEQKRATKLLFNQFLVLEAFNFPKPFFSI